MRSGANLLERSFLCTTMKLTSDALSSFFRTRRVTGIAEMKATRRRDSLARMPLCHSAFHSGDVRALYLLASFSKFEARLLTISKMTSSS